MERAASIYSRFFTDRICPRKSRAFPIQPKAVSTAMILNKLGFKRVTTVISRKNCGKASMISTNRIRMLSTLPP
ncbi:hypothetical protein D3C81_1544770 [compost metagenome]